MKNAAIYPFFEKLFSHYGPQHWWPCRSGKRWEIICGAILTQNTAWNNVEKALDLLEKNKIDSAGKLLALPLAELQEMIRPAGFFQQKSLYLKGMAEFFLREETRFLASSDYRLLRRELLQLKGVGRETADSILLYAFQKPIFVIDAYTRRVAERHLELDGKLPYDALQEIFMDSLPSDTALYGEYHALIVTLCKESCKKSSCGEICRKL